MLNISPLPIGIRSPSLTLKWIAPGPGHEPSGIDVTADIPSVPDPLVAMVPLEEGAHDDGGRTFNKDNVEIAERGASSTSSASASELWIRCHNGSFWNI